MCDTLAAVLAAHRKTGCQGGERDYLSRMLPRSLCTALLALLAWLPLGHAQSLALRGNPREPALAATSALDIAADSPARIGTEENFSVRTLPFRRLDKAYGGDGGFLADAVFLADVSTTRPNLGRVTGRDVSSARAKRLTIPHDATAPPRNQS